MAEVSERVDGVPDERGKVEKWSKWLVKDGKVEYDGITSPELKKLVRSLAKRPDEFTPPEKLAEFYEEFEAMQQTLDLSSRQRALEYMDRIAGRVIDLTERGRGRETLQPVPLYFGAVFKDGKNEIHVSRHDLIPSLNLKKPEDRKEFIFRNIHAFDYRFRTPTAWKGAIDDWLQDTIIANEALGEARLSPEEVRHFEKELKAMMAVTASARAMELSGGAMKNYLETLVGLDPKGNPNLDDQEKWGTFLLHSDPEKMMLVLANSTVERYYKILMKDAGLQYDPENNEWQDNPDSKDPNKREQKASHLVWIGEKGERLTEQKDIEKSVTQLRESGRLIQYLKNMARDGAGFQKYIQEVLLEEGDGNESREVRMAAARIACDVFLVDKYTRWEFILTIPERLSEGGKEAYKKRTGTKEVRDLNLQPLEDWGGDPLRSIIEPSFVARHLKKVYAGKDAAILDLADAALLPKDYFAEIRSDGNKPEEERKYKDVSKIHALVPSMVTNAKKLSRLSDAMYKTFGDSMANGLPSWNNKMLEELPSIADLLTQIYGGMTVTETTSGEKIPLGKHMVGAMMMRLLYAKSLATSAESASPNFLDLIKTSSDPESKTRPFMEVLYTLYGAKLDAKSGFIQTLTGPKTRLILRDNMFDAEKFYSATYDLLQTNDQTGKSTTLAAYIRLGASLVNFLGDASGSMGGKKR